MTLPNDQREFYARCSDILGVPHEFAHRYERRNRWNHRQLGNGRYPGYGTIRWFARDRIHLSFHSPPRTMTFTDPEAVYSYLRMNVDRAP